MLYVPVATSLLVIPVLHAFALSVVALLMVIGTVYFIVGLVGALPHVAGSIGSDPSSL
jgi:hypothetical protein